MLGAAGGTRSQAVTNSVFCRRPQSLSMRSRALSAPARQTRRRHRPGSDDETTRLFTGRWTEPVFRERTSENVECAAFAVGPFGLWQRRVVVAAVGTVLREWMV